jgi:hypothetical protein
MAKTTMGFGVVLVLLGIVGYVGTGAHSPTALIPAALGVVLVVMGLLARRPGLRMHAMHGAALAGLIGIAGSVGGIPPFVRMLAGETVPRPAAAITRTTMAVLCLAFVALTVRSFIAARVARRKAQSTAPMA